MSITALQLTAKVTADTSEAEANLKRVQSAADNASGQTGGGGIKGFITHVAELVTAQAIFHGAADAIGFLAGQVQDAVQAAGQYQIIQSQTVAGLKSTKDASGETAASIQNLAEQYSQVTTFSRDAVQQAENITLTFTNIGKNIFPQATMAAMDLSQRLGINLPNATILVDKALQDPIKGITALRRVGVDLSKQQEDQIKHFMKLGDVMDAQKIILGELNTEVGGSAVAAGKTYAGALQILQNQLEDTKEKIGAALIPILTQLMTALGPILSAFADFTGQELGGLSSFITGTVIPVMQQWLPVLGDILDAAQHLGDIFMNALSPALDTIQGAFSKLQGPGLSVGQVVQGITNVVQRLTPFVKEAGKVIGDIAVVFVTQVIPAIVRFDQFVVANVLPVLAQIGQFIVTQVIPFLAQLVGWFIKNVMPVLMQVAQVVVANVIPAFQSIAQAIETMLWPQIKNLISAFQQVWDKLSPVLIPTLQFLGGILQNVLVPIIRTVIGVISGFIAVDAALVTAFAWVIGKVGDLLGLLGKLKDFLGGPLTTAWNAIGSVVSGIWNGISLAVKGGIDGVISIINGLISAIDSININIPSVGPFGGGHIGFSIPLLPYLAKGGDVEDEGPFMVGEKGPEILSGKKGARVTPLPSGLAAAGAGASGPITITVPLVVDGLKLAQVTAKHMHDVVRQATGQRGM